jgi:hypothetical protein
MLTNFKYVQCSVLSLLGLSCLARRLPQSLLAHIIIFMHVGDAGVPTDVCRQAHLRKVVCEGIIPRRYGGHCKIIKFCSIG